MKHFFIWTVGDVFAVVFLGLLLLFGGFIGLLVLWEKFKNWMRPRTGGEKP